MPKQPRPHAEIIRAWADGEQIQYRNRESYGKWVDTECPAFVDDFDYRVKPVRDLGKRDTMIEIKVPEELWSKVVFVKC